MKRVFLLTTACALLAAPAFAQSPSSQPSPPANAASQDTQPQPSQGAAEPAPSTADFVKKAAISDMFEIQSSHLALEKHAKGDRRFARTMIHDHSHTTAQLKRLVNSGKVKASLPTALDSEHQQLLDQLSKESGGQFDKDYDKAQLDGHKQAVAMFESYAKSGDNPALKRWAAKTLPLLQEHLSMAEKLSSR